jgi:hypothetical protein
MFVGGLCSPISEHFKRKMLQDIGRRFSPEPTKAEPQKRLSHAGTENF